MLTSFIRQFPSVRGRTTPSARGSQRKIGDEPRVETDFGITSGSHAVEDASGKNDIIIQ
jgi:hypothetical protein